MKITIKTLITLAAMLGTSTAAFAGTLGVNYYGVGLGYGENWHSNGPDTTGWGAGVGINHNVAQEADFAVDVHSNFDYRRGSGGALRSRTNTLTAGATAFTEFEGIRPFAGIETGWSWNRTRYQSLRMTDDSWLYGARFGAEIPVDADLSITPYATWTHYDSISDSKWAIGVSALYWLDDGIGVGLDYTLTEGPNKSATLIANVNFRY